MNRKLLLSVTATLAFSTFLAGAPKVSSITSTLIEFGYTPVGLKRAHNSVYAACKVGGQSLDFIVDTGAQATLISASKSSMLAGPAKKVDGHAIGVMGEMSASLRVGEVNDFQVGPYKGGSHRVGIWDFSRHPRPGIGMSTDGLLGIDFLHHHQAVIDCFQMNLFLKSPSATSTSAALGAGLRAGGCTEIQLHPTPSGLAVSTRIDGMSGYLIVDTGMPWTTLREHAITDLKLRRASAGFKGLGDASGKQGTRLFMVYPSTMEIGSFSVPSQGLAVADLPTLKAGGPGTVFFGYLGQDLLAYYVGIIDCGALKLYLRLDPVIEAARKKRS